MTTNASTLLPIANAYWVIPNQLLAGEYPAFIGTPDAVQRLNAFLDAGITLFLDLTVAGEYDAPDYGPLLQELGEQRAKKVYHVRYPIRDMHAPSLEVMRDIQQTLKLAFAQGEVVYVHCFGGIGRTGTVIGCFLAEQGSSGKAAIAKLARMRRGIPSANRKSPETRSQRAMVEKW